jgi:hypothetical protein
VNKQLTSNIDKRSKSRLPPDLAKQSGKTSGKTKGWDKGKPPSGDLTRKKLEDRHNAFKGDKRTADFASRHNRMLTGKDRDALERVLHDPKAPPDLKHAVRDALREDARMKKLLAGAFHHHGWHHGQHPPWDPWRHHPGFDPFHWGGVYVTPIDFGGLFGGIATLVSVATGGGGIVGLPPVMIDDGSAIFEPVGVVGPSVVNATSFGSYRGVYYNVQDPVDPYAGDAAPPPAADTSDMSYTDDASTGPTSIVFHSRYLLIGNASNEKVTVHVQYLTQDQNGNWVWLPGDPENPETAGQSVTYDLEPGQNGYAFDGEWQINACRVRIWAESESGTVWDTYKVNDFLLVAETDEEGIPSYVAPEMGTVKWVVK